MFAISNYNSVLFDAIMENNVEKCRAMKKMDISRELQYRYRLGVLGQCPLHVAVLSAHSFDVVTGLKKHDRAVEIIEWLLQAGAELEVVNELGGTPVKSAVMAADEVTVSLLVSVGANITFEKSDSYGRSALHLACMNIRAQSNECFKLVQYLIQQRVDVSHRNEVCL